MGIYDDWASSLKIYEGDIEPVVTLYDDSHHGGLNVKNYYSHCRDNYIGVGINDKVSSVYIKDGYKVTLYEHHSFDGSKIELTESTDWLGDFNDITSSVIIEKIEF